MVDVVPPAVEAYLRELRREFPRLRLVDKTSSPFSRLLDLALRGITLGGQRRFMTAYVTTIGRTIYLPRGFRDRSPEAQLIVLRHEAVHLRQTRRYTTVGMGLLYLVPILPLGLAYGRARLEWEAYAETLRATAELRGLAAAKSPGLRDHIVRQFTTSAYGWMWPFPRQVGRWIAAEVAAIEAEAIRGRA
ncbi:MAG: hypothetical protein ACFCGT_27885 [Sandaracinaceae bacterium]